ncbi:hypothetical protein KKH03_01400, partial [Patescibacteria group bacterium]|nr:hypothetical protein [Patescibacteria group bacterium]
MPFKEEPVISGPDKSIINISTQGSPVETLMRGSIVPGLIAIGYPPQPEQNVFNEWMENLTEDETAHYDKLGYLLKLLRSICETPNSIALPEEESFPEKISYREIIELMQEILFHAEQFYGNEEKFKSWQIREFRALYHALYKIKDQLGDSKGDLEYNRTLRDFLPESFKYLVSNKATESAKEKIKGELQKSYSLSKEEFSILLEALRHLKLYYK